MEKQTRLKLTTWRTQNNKTLLYGDNPIAVLREDNLSLMPWNYQNNESAFCKVVTAFLQENHTPKSKLFVEGDFYVFTNEVCTAHSIETTIPEIQIHFGKQARSAGSQDE